MPITPKKVFASVKIRRDKQYPTSDAAVERKGRSFRGELEFAGDLGRFSEGKFLGRKNSNPSRQTPCVANERRVGVLYLINCLAT